jgi:hypothetical protein
MVGRGSRTAEYSLHGRLARSQISMGLRQNARRAAAQDLPSPTGVASLSGCCMKFDPRLLANSGIGSARVSASVVMRLQKICSLAKIMGSAGASPHQFLRSPFRRSPYRPFALSPTRPSRARCRR